MESNRTEPMIATYLHHKGGKLGLPVSGTFELTARCNFSCPMCYVHLCKDEIAKRGQELSAQQWISLAQQARDAGMMFALLTGGEPFLRPDFFEIYDSMKDMGLMISINTNGSLIKGEILQRLLDNPPFRMNISLYGGNPDTYRNMCGTDAFEQVVEAIRTLKSAGVDIRLNLSLTPYNQEDMERIYELSRELDVHIKCNTYMYPPVRVQGVSDSNSRFSPEQAARFATRWESLRLSPDDFITRERNVLSLCALDEDQCAVDTDEGVRCRAGRSSFWLAWDGRMLPCGMMTFPCAKPLEEGFLTAWESIKEESKEIRLPRKCLSCPKKKICNHCAAVCVTETGSFDGVPDYMCQYTDELIVQAQEILKEEE